jgi:hypothetical protein
MAKQTDPAAKSARIPSKQSKAVASTPSTNSGSGTQSESKIESEELDSPLKPLMWLLIPLVLVLLYAFLAAH